MSKFIVASKQATKLDKERIRLESMVHDMGKEANRKDGEKMKLVDEGKELKNLIKELKNLIKKLRANIVDDGNSSRPSPKEKQ